MKCTVLVILEDCLVFRWSFYSMIIYAIHRVDMSSTLTACQINIDRSCPLRGFQRRSREKCALWTFDKFREKALIIRRSGEHVAI